MLIRQMEKDKKKMYKDVFISNRKTLLTRKKRCGQQIGNRTYANRKRMTRKTE